MEFDVAIIGSGPAGAMAARTLAEAGLNIAVVEKHRLPRYKPCGGLMPRSMRDLIGPTLDELVDHSVSRFDFMHAFDQAHTLRTPEDALLLVERARFDAGLLESAIVLSRGSIKLIENFQVRDVIEGPALVEIRSRNKCMIRARTVIAADGASSITARCLNLATTHEMAVSIDAEVRVRSKFYQEVSDRVLFHYFVLPVGYGWLFPKGRDTLSCGIVTWSSEKLQLQSIMAKFLAASIPKQHILQVNQRGYPIPAFAGNADISSARVCLAGDAAGLVDPVTGEGISYAIRSGVIAGQSVLAVLRNENSDNPIDLDCRIYQYQINDGPGAVLGKIHRFAALPFKQAPKHYYQKFIVGAGIQHHYSM